MIKVSVCEKNQNPDKRIAKVTSNLVKTKEGVLFSANISKTIAP